MGLFPSANDFKAGKGVEKDAPRKTGIGRFFELVGRDMNGMFLANLLTCIGFAPVICLVYIGFLQNSLPVMLGSAAVGGLLAGPALAGMYDTVLRALRDEAGYWWVTYRKAFKRNFKASLVPGVLYTVVVTLQIFLVYFCFNMLSKGTNVGATVAALTGLGADRRLVVILGGEGKGQDFSPLAAPVARSARAVVLMGRDAPLIRAALQGAGVALVDAQTLPHAVQLAAQHARPGDAVLMSPACASFDMFRDYAHRAQVFCDAVRELAHDAGQELEGMQ